MHFALFCCELRRLDSALVQSIPSRMPSPPIASRLLFFRITSRVTFVCFFFWMVHRYLV